MTDFTGAQLATILSALDGQTRNPASKAAALAAIRRHADEIGCTVEDILAAAAGLLDGRMSADDFRAALRDDGATNEPGDDAATDVAEQDAQAPVAATAARPANRRERRGFPKQRSPPQAADTAAAEHSAGETRPDNILRTLRAAIDRARQQPRRRPRGNSRANRTPTPSKPASSRCCIKVLRSATWPASSAGCGIPATARLPG
jgi:hypothetical protein